MTTAAETAQYEAAVTEFSKVALTVPNEQRERFFHMIKEMTRAIRQARWRADVIAAATRGCE